MGGSGSKNKGEEKPSKKASVKESKKEERSKSVKETKSEKAKEVPIFAAPTEPPKAIDVEKHETKAIKGRLAAGVDTSHLKSALEEKEARMAQKMFTPAQEEKHSKIYNALNPQNLWYESRRSKEMAKENEGDDDEDEDEKVQIRDSFSARIVDDTGNVMVEEEEAVEEEWDGKTVPTFDAETEAELKVLRAKRAEELANRQQKLREAFLAKKAEEERLRQEEIKTILAEEAKKKKKEEVSDSDVKAAQARVAEAIQFSDFGWK
eukprot:m.64338 g.64338  ORF g.64338 m.64338 type:complete len:264 (+) comp49707_c0_seq4:68-859(+)